MNLNAPYTTPFEYPDYFSLALAYRPEAKRALFIGLGGGSGPKRFWRDFPQLDVDAVELDKEVVNVAYRFFQPPRDLRLEVDVEDGRRTEKTDEVGRDPARRVLLGLGALPSRDP